MSIPIATELKSELKKYFENRYARTQALDSTLHALEARNHNKRAIILHI